MSLLDQPATPEPKWPAWAVTGILLLLVAVIYGQTLDFEFTHYDDNAYVFENPHVRAGLTGQSILWAFTDGPVGEWYPTTMLSHMLDCQLYGLEAGRHHLTNVLLHAATAIGLLLVLRSMTGELWPSAFVAALFAVHPQNVESVVWIAERRDVLSGLFFVLTLGAYLGYVRHGRTVGRYLLVVVLLALGLMAKPILVTVPCLLLLLDYWPLGRFGPASDLPAASAARARQHFWWLALEKLPLMILAIFAALMAVTRHYPDSSSSWMGWQLRSANALICPFKYLLHVVYPVDLAIFYPYPSAGYPTWEVVAAVIVLAVICDALFDRQRKYPYLFVGWFWFLGMLVPVSGVVQLSAHAMADRYMYLPGIGIFIAVAWSAARLLVTSPGRWWMRFGGAAAVIVLLTALSFKQTWYWGDDERLWRHAMATTEDNGRTEGMLASVLSRKGELDEAIEHYRRAKELRVLIDSYLLNNLGAVLERRAQPGDLEEAVTEYRDAIKIEPGNATIRENLGATLLLRGQLEEAISELKAALAIQPSASVHVKLAQALAASGQTEAAIAHYRAALEINPAQPTVRERLDRLLGGQTSPTDQDAQSR